MTEEEKQAEIARLKEEAIAAKKRIDDVIAEGRFDLSDTARQQIVQAANQKYALKDSNTLLKEAGVSRATRRKLAYMKKRGPQKIPAHTARAVAVAQKAKAA